MSRKPGTKKPGKDSSPTRNNDPSPARSETKVEDFVKCELCRQMLDQPKTLTCLHSFCKGCIKTYVSETIGKDAGKDIICPVCLQTTPQPKGAKSVEDSVNDLPTNEFVRSYLEALGLQDPNRKCDTCLRQGKSEAAQQWCSSCHDALCIKCVGFHNALKTTKKHSLNELSKLRHLPIQTIIVTPHCATHDGETVTRYCSAHSEVMCDKCAMGPHKNCREVKTIKEAAAANKTDFGKTKSVLSDGTTFAKALYDDRSKEDRMLDGQQAALLQKIQSVRKKINDNLMKCESQIINELYETHGKSKTPLQADTKEAQRIRKAATKIHGLCDNISTHGNDAHVLQTKDDAATQGDHYRGKLMSLNNKVKHSNIEFNIDPVLERLMTGIQRLGEIKVTTKSALLPTTQTLSTAKTNDSDPEDELDIRKSRVSFKEDTKSLKSFGSVRSLRSMRSVLVDIKPTLEESFSVKTPTDTESCWITGIAFLPDGQIVLVDRNNSKLKLINRRNVIGQEFRLNYQPFGITSMGDGVIAVTLPRENKIEIYKVTNVFTLIDTVKTSDRAYGISYAGERFAVAFSCASPPHIKVLTRRGVEKSYICPDGTYHPMFLRPWYVKMDSSGTTIFISDCHTCHVTSISGTVVRKYFYKDDSLNSPRGLHVTKDGRLLVSGFGTDNVQLLNASGQHISDVLTRNDSIMGPQDVAMNSDENRMVVTFDPSSGKSDYVNAYHVTM